MHFQVTGRPMPRLSKKQREQWEAKAAQSRAETDARIEEARKVRRKPVCQLTGTDGNAFAVIGAVSRCLKEAGQRQRAADWQIELILSISYDALLNLAHDYVDVR